MAAENDAVSLNPLVMIFAINDDVRFTAAEARALVRAVKHTDNSSRQVRMSQAGIAEGVAVSRHTVQRSFSKAKAYGYFSRSQRRKNERGHFVTDYWFASVPPFRAPEVFHAAGVMRGVPDPVPHSMPQESTPSTTSTPLLSEDPVQHPCDMEITPPCFEHGISECASCHGSEANVEMCDLHGSFAKDACTYCARPKRKSSLPDWKQRQIYEDQLEREGLNAFGSGVAEPAAQLPRYQGHSRR